MKKSNHFIKTIAVFAAVFTSCSFAHAAAIPRAILEAPHQTVSSGQEYAVDVSIDTVGAPANTVSASIEYPSDLLTFKGASDGGSVIALWVNRPALDALGNIVFAGIIPGGYDGPRGRIVRLIFLAKRPGTGAVGFKSLELLANDGKGTKLAATEDNSDFSVIAGASTGTSASDTDLPEPFRPVVAKDPSIFGGAYFLSFSTTDKGSGIDHYEIKEANSAYIKAESPYRIADQSLSSEILVTAIDRAHNRRIEAFIPNGMLKRGLFIGGIVLAIVVLLCAIVIYMRRRRA